ncbi:MAG: hypothetical protein QOI04_252 [Verrucomicrobiota bacterium]
MPTRLLFSGVFFLQALVLYFALTQQFPISGDDYSYLYQAKLFAAGKLYAEDPLYDRTSPLHGCVETNCIKDFHGRRFSQYQPGWPVIMAIGAALGVPWVVNPLLGALLVFLMLLYVERQMGEELVAQTGLLLTLCFFFAYYAASSRAHIAMALFVFAAFLAYDAADRRRAHAQMWLLFVAGALLGYSSIIRYTDWIPLGAWIGFSLLRRKNFAGLTLFAVGFTLLAAGNLIYDALLSGNPFQIPMTINSTSGMNGLWIGLKVTGLRLAYLFGIFPPVLLLALFGTRYRPSSKVKMYLALFLMSVGIYFFYPKLPGGPGPRYLLTYFPFLILAVVELYRWIDKGTRIESYLWRVSIVCLLVGNLIFATVEGYTMYGRRDLERTEKQLGTGKKIFLLTNGTYQTNRRDLTRNPPDLSTAENLYFLWCAEPERDALLNRFPNREIFVYEYPSHLYPYVRDGKM